MNILVTGGAGYIGSHISADLLRAGNRVVVLDNFSNSSRSVIKRIGLATGRNIVSAELDIRDLTAMTEILVRESINIVVHCAGMKSVAESVSNPIQYYDVNVGGSLCLLKAMKAAGVRDIIFSSSATIYGEPAYLPLNEHHEIKPINPYGHTKAIIEKMLIDICIADPAFTAISLRYFNPVGADKMGLLGDDPADEPQNLVPYIFGVINGRYPCLNIFGDDYCTEDGTGVRDYIHVLDLARAHTSVAERLPSLRGYDCVNLGVGKGHSVLEVMKAIERVTGRSIPVKISARRPGDVDACFTSNDKARQLLGWEPIYTLEDACQDAWNFYT